MPARFSRSASKSGMRLRRQEVSASSPTSWVSVGVAGWYSSTNCWVFGGEDGRAGRQAMAQRVERRALFTGFGARTGGMLGVGAVDGGAIDGSDWGSGHIGHLGTGITWARGRGRVTILQVVDMEAKIAWRRRVTAIPSAQEKPGVMPPRGRHSASDSNSLNVAAT
jgi:hypothetical protein